MSYAMYSYNPDRQGLSEVKILNLESWRKYPGGAELCTDFLAQPPPEGLVIDKDTPIASIGSCFAREIKTWLKKHGYHFIETAQGPCTEAGSARYDRVYNTFTLKQEFERAFGEFTPEETRWVVEEDGRQHLIDPYRKGVAWEDADEMARELAEHAEDVRRAFTSAAVLVITIGQAEIWYSKKDGYVYPLVPPTQVFDSEIHGFRRSTHDENLSNLERVRELFKANNANGKIIVTLSPVPLRATFRKTNSLIANAASKAILRAAIDGFADAHDDVTYFPPYEVVTCTEEQPFKDDNRHVRRETVDRIMSLFETWFLR